MCSLPHFFGVARQFDFLYIPVGTRVNAHIFTALPLISGQGRVLLLNGCKGDYTDFICS
jgi:hypothetical protein